MPFHYRLPADGGMNAWCQGCRTTKQPTRCSNWVVSHFPAMLFYEMCKRYQWLWRASLTDFCQLFDSNVVGELLMQMNGSQMSRLDRRRREWLLLLIIIFQVRSRMKNSFMLQGNKTDENAQEPKAMERKKLLSVVVLLLSLFAAPADASHSSSHCVCPFTTTTHFLFCSCHVVVCACLGGCIVNNVYMVVWPFYTWTIVHMETNCKNTYGEKCAVVAY